MIFISRAVTLDKGKYAALKHRISAHFKWIQIKLSHPQLQVLVLNNIICDKSNMVQMFADHESSLNPIAVPRSLIWNLTRRTVYFGTSVTSIFKGDYFYNQNLMFVLSNLHMTKIYLDVARTTYRGYSILLLERYSVLLDI